MSFFGEFESNVTVASRSPSLIFGSIEVPRKTTVLWPKSEQFTVSKDKTTMATIPSFICFIGICESAANVGVDQVRPLRPIFDSIINLGKHPDTSGLRSNEMWA